MALVVDDVAEDLRFSRRKFGAMENHGSSENLSVGFLMKEMKTYGVANADPDYLMYLITNSDVAAKDRRVLKKKFGTIENHGPSENLSVGLLMKEREIYGADNGDVEYFTHLNGDISISDGPLHELSVEDDGDDPGYALFLSRLKQDGHSYILPADERIGLTKPLKYEEDETNDVDQEDLNGPSKTQLMESVIDEDYAFFRKNLKLNGSSLVYQCDNGLPVVYDGKNLPDFQRDNGSNSWKQKCKLSMHKEKSRYSLGEDSTSKCDNRKRKRCSMFRMQIMRILSKPYDKEEHQKLLEQITVQKPQLKHIDLRSGRVRFIESDKKGKSLLEYHGDLRRKVRAAAKDDCKQLNLLRGFFFWIQNLTQEESFIPWHDEECLAMRPC